tara:strand:- start:486 stop:935 length:450 start_codon:yes stop_codon:yes gene_type:complete
MKEKHFNQNLIKFWGSVVLSLIPLILLLNDYIYFEKYKNILLTNYVNLGLENNIFAIIIYFLIINIITIYLRFIDSDYLFYQKNLLLFLPALHGIIIAIFLVYGVYGNKKCNDLPLERQCSCFYVAAKNEVEEFKNIFNQNCKNIFNKL